MFKEALQYPVDLPILPSRCCRDRAGHREFFDGTGYPRGLRDEQIPLGARIISVANAFDAMLTDWPYRNALAVSHVREEIRRCAGTQFDPKIVEVFLTIPENHWTELRENLGSPFRLAQLKNLKRM
jgi:HD-GYP domain-containing protein (c-di-GMP phosphodiesterase class II)